MSNTDGRSAFHSLTDLMIVLEMIQQSSSSSSSSHRLWTCFFLRLFDERFVSHSRSRKESLSDSQIVQMRLQVQQQRLKVEEERYAPIRFIHCSSWIMFARFCFVVVLGRGGGLTHFADLVQV